MSGSDGWLGKGPSHQSVRDPEGNEFFVQAVPSFGVSGPVWLAKESDPFPQRGLLRLVNRLLARVQRPQSFESAAVTVVRVGAQGEDTVLFEPLDTLAEALNRAASIAQEIESGQFGSGPT